MKITIDEIDALLPQTQCGLCNYAGCRPYANAILNNQAPIDCCPPGGIDTLNALANLLEIDPTPFVEDMQCKAKSSAIAVIREDECIGCTKCIQACPTDAIIGSHKKMHTVITEACTGCELCVTPCPVDCIDILTIKRSQEEKRQKATEWRARYIAHNQRLEQNTEQTKTPIPITSIQTRQEAIADAVARVRNKKNQPQNPAEKNS